MNSFYSEEELGQLGLGAYGKDVLISRNASIYGAGNIFLGDHVRIDDFCILSGHIRMDGYNHISAGCMFFAGAAGIVLEEFAGVSSRSAIYAASDDYSGAALTGPTVPEEFRLVTEAPVRLGRHVLIGSGSTILPGVTVGEGSSVGSMSLVNRSLDSWGMYVGIPCRRLRDRSRELLTLEKQLKEKES